MLSSQHKKTAAPFMADLLHKFLIIFDQSFHQYKVVSDLIFEIAEFHFSNVSYYAGC